MAEEGRRIRSRKALLVITAKQSFVNAKSILRACFSAPLEERSFSFTVSPPGTTRPLHSPAGTPLRGSTGNTEGDEQSRNSMDLSANSYHRSPPRHRKTKTIVILFKYAYNT